MSPHSTALLLDNCHATVHSNLFYSVLLRAIFRFLANSLLQVLGHTKTILILTGGWLFFNELISGQQVVGICLAIMGMILYSYFSMR